PREVRTHVALALTRQPVHQQPRPAPHLQHTPRPQRPHTLHRPLHPLPHLLLAQRLPRVAAPPSRHVERPVPHLLLQRRLEHPPPLLHLLRSQTPLRLARRHHVRHQPLPVPPPLPPPPPRSPHPPVPAQHRLHLARLHPVPTHLHLLVHPTHVLQLTAPQPPRQVPRPVHPAPRLPIRVGHEPLPRLP